jgi:hypothetical protein
MAVLGVTAVKDIYKESTVTLATDATAGDNLRIDSLGQASPNDPDYLPTVIPAPADYSIASYNSTILSSNSYGNSTLPDGRVLLALHHVSVSAWKVILLDTDGVTRLGTSSLDFTPTNSTANLFTAPIVFTQLGESSDGLNWLVGVGCKGYYQAASWFYHLVKIIRISKTADTMAHAADVTSFTAATVLTSTSTFGVSPNNVHDMHTCRGGSVFLYFAQKTSATVYTLTTRVLTGTGALGTGSDTTTFTDLMHSMFVVPIDDANGIFLVSHVAVSGTRTLVRLDVAANGTITTLVLASMGAAYTDLDTNINRNECMVTGGGTGSTNLCFFNVNSATTIRTQTCTYDPSNNSLTWGTYQSLSTPIHHGYTRHTMFGTGDLAATRYAWDYSPYYKTIYINYSLGNPYTDDVNYGTGLALNIDNMTISAANIAIDPSIVATHLQEVYAPAGGTQLVVKYAAGDITARKHVTGVDTGLLVTQNRSAVAIGSGTIGDTIAVALTDGVISTNTLPASHYLKKDGYYFPYQIYESSGLASNTVTPSANVIKSVQAGTIYWPNLTLSERSASINNVNPLKSFVVHTSPMVPLRLYLDDDGQNVVSAAAGGTGIAGQTVSWQVIEYV